MRFTFAVLLLVILFSGCADFTESDRLACLELAKDSFANIPDCNSHAKCFAKIDEFSNIKTEMLDKSSASEILSAKNHLAKAWFSIHAARKNLSSIRQSCEKNDFSKISQEVNELNSNMLSVSSSIDKFNIAAASAIGFENKRLHAEEIDLIAEEPLYEDFVLLNQNIVDFSQKNEYGSSYASRFLHEYSKFMKVAEALNSTELVSDNSILRQLGKSLEITSSIKHENFTIKLLSPLFAGISGFLSDFFNLKGSVSELKKTPAFELFSATGKIIGAKNSAASEFFSLFISEAQHIKELNEKNEKLELEINENIRKIEADTHQAFETIKILSKMPGIPGKDQGVIEIISLGKDFSGFEEIFGKLSFAKTKLESIKESSINGKLALGQKTRKLKDLNYDIAQINLHLLEIKNIANSALTVCNENVNFIYKKFSSKEFETQNSSLISLKALLHAKISLYKEKSSLVKCSEIYSLYNNLVSMFSEKHPENTISKEIYDCVSVSEKWLEISKNPEYLENLETIKREFPNFANHSLSLESCKNILSNIAKEASESQEGENFLKNYSRIADFSSQIESVLLNYPEINFKTNFAENPNFCSQKMREFGKYVFSGRLDVESIDSLARLKELSNASNEIAGKCESMLKSVASEFVQAELSGMCNEDTNYRECKLYFDNKAKPIKTPFSVELQIDSSKAVMSASTGNTNFFSTGKKTSILFSWLDTGINGLTLVFDSESDLNRGKQDKNISAVVSILSEKRALLSKLADLNFDDSQTNTLSKKIDSLIDSGNTMEAENNLSSLRKLVETTISKKASFEELSNKSKEISKCLSEISTYLQRIKKASTEFENNFSDVNSEEISLIYHLLPLGSQRLKIFLEPLDSSSKKVIEEANSLISNGKIAEAVSIAEKENICQLSKNLLSLAIEAESSLEKLKENSLAAFNAAEMKISEYEYNPEANKQLAEAKTALENKSYIKSIVKSNQASGMATIPKQPENLNPAIYIFVITILASAIYLAFRKPNEDKPKETSKIRKFGDSVHEDKASQNI
jgi:hypothetical protein